MLRRPSRRAAPVIAAGCLALLLVAALGWWGVSLERPPETPPRPADAVVVLAGPGARLAVARRLVDGGLAPVAAVSITSGEACPTVGDARVTCFVPDPLSTRGEAEALGRLARLRGWRRLLVVAGHEQARRAALRVERCFAGPVQVVPAPAAASVWTRLHQVAYEAAATVKADLWQRSC